MIEQFNLMRILRAAQLLARSYPVYIWASSEGIWVVGANESEKIILIGFELRHYGFCFMVTRELNYVLINKALLNFNLN